MSSVLTAKVKIRGMRPIMWHRFGPESLPLEKQERSGVAGNDPTEWQRSVECTKDGQLYIRGDQVFSCLRNAARHTKKGRGSIQPLIAATLQELDDRIPLDRFIPGWDGGPPDTLTTDSDAPVYLDIRSVRNPSTKGRNVRYRVAASSDWHCEFELLWDATIGSRGQMEAVCIDAGKLEGLGNGRSLGLGRFDVQAFEVMG